MNRISAILRRFARTYLVAMGGGFALVTAIGLIENYKGLSPLSDKSDARYLRESGLALLISVLAVVAGFAIHKFRRWGILLAAAIGVFVVGHSAPTVIPNPVEPGTFTIWLPMVLILLWAALPATWLQFKRQGADTP